jgi:hypothetical protein
MLKESISKTKGWGGGKEFNLKEKKGGVWGFTSDK